MQGIGYAYTAEIGGQCMELIFLVIWVIVLGGVGWWIAQQKNRSEVEGAALGCFLGPIGWVIEAVLPTAEVPASPPRRLETYGPRSDRPRAASGATGTLVPGTILFAYAEWAGEGTPDAAMRVAETLVARQAAEGKVLVEAVWQDDQHSNLGLAFGIPGFSYARKWPHGEDVSDDIVQSEPTAESTTQQPSERPIKICPDCAEVVFEAARICRFCRYEFWPADTPPPPTPVDASDDSVMPSPEALTPSGEMTEAQAVLVATEAASQPTEPGADMAQQDERPQPDPLVVEPIPEPEAWTEERAPMPPAPRPAPYAPPPPPWAAPPPTYPPLRPPYAPPPPGWQPPQGPPPGQVPPQRPSPWPPPPERPRQ
jgi:hypothetical protein